MPPKVLQEIMGHTDIRVTMNTYFYATTEYIGEHMATMYTALESEGLLPTAPTAGSGLLNERYA